MKRSNYSRKLSPGFWISRLEIILIKNIYQVFLSPFLGRWCRFSPTCSNYALEALQKYPLLKANGKILWRILRCNPLCKGGYDPA